MGLKDECLRLYRQNERITRWQNGGYRLRSLKALKERAMMIFGKGVKCTFTKEGSSNVLLIKEDGIFFMLKRGNDEYDPSKYTLRLVSICKRCLSPNTHTHLGNLTTIAKATKLIIARYIVEKEYKPYYTCFHCQKEQQQEEASLEAS